MSTNLSDPSLIRKATQSDLNAIQQIARRTIDNSYRPILGDESVDFFINSGESDKEIASNVRSCIVLEQQDRIVAFAIYFESTIHLMMVDFQHHRNGFGSELLAYVEDELSSQGASLLRLETFKGHDQAIQFYLNNGWTIDREEPDRKNGFTRVFFEKTL